MDTQRKRGDGARNKVVGVGSGPTPNNVLFWD